MSQNKKIANRYAKAFFSLWSKQLDKKDIKNIILSVENLVDSVLGKSDIQVLWYSSGFHESEKMKLVEILRTKKLPKEVLDLLSFLIKRKRTSIVGNLVSSLKDLYNKHTKTLVVDISSAFELSSSDKQEIQEVVQSLKIAQGHHCEFSFKIEPRLLGGILLKIGRYVYDYSLKSSFDQLRRKVETMDIRELVAQRGSA